MPHLILRSYSHYADHVTGLELTPVLLIGVGIRVAHLSVTDKQAEAFNSRPAFEILSDDEFLALTKAPAAPEPDGPAEGGEPLSGAPTPGAKGTKTSGAKGTK